MDTSESPYVQGTERGHEGDLIFTSRTSAEGTYPFLLLSGLLQLTFFLFVELIRNILYGQLNGSEKNMELNCR